MMRITLRIQDQNSHHTHFMVFINGRCVHSGALTTTNAEYQELCALLLAGAKETEHVIWAMPATLEMFRDGA